MRGPTTPHGLPLAPSALLELALSDLAKAERTQNFEVDFNYWFATCTDDKPYRAGFAGVVMFKTLKLPKDQDADPNDCPVLDGFLMHALAAAACWHWGEYLQRVRMARMWEFHGNEPTPRTLAAAARALERIPFTDYASDRGEFKSRMRQAVRQLKKRRM